MADDRQQTGSGDPDRTLELLWGALEPPTRGPKPGLSVERIVATAVALADADGIAAVSMRKVADALGVGTMSLYRYVPGKGELLDLMYEHAVADEPRQADDGRSWRERTEAAARASLATYRRHPWLLDVVAGNRPPLGPNVMDAYEGWLRVVAASGLPPREVSATVELISTYVRGAARAAIEQQQAEARSGVSDEQWWESRRGFWERYFKPERYPTMTALYTENAYEQPLDSFEYGLARLLDGVAARVAAVTAPPPA
jgi:AcrR family transcriptional regulator